MMGLVSIGEKHVHMLDDLHVDATGLSANIQQKRGPLRTEEGSWGSTRPHDKHPGLLPPHYMIFENLEFHRNGLRAVNLFSDQLDCR